MLVLAGNEGERNEGLMNRPSHQMNTRRGRYNLWRPPGWVRAVLHICANLSLKIAVLDMTTKGRFRSRM